MGKFTGALIILVILIVLYLLIQKVKSINKLGVMDKINGFQKTIFSNGHF